MSRRWSAPVLVTAAALAVAAAEPPDDFKLVTELFGPGKAPMATADLVVRQGVGYQFIREVPEEVMIIDPARGRVVLLDLERAIQTELTSQRLDAALARTFRAASAAAERREKAGSRADRVSAAISRDLIEPRFAESYDPARHRVRLTNPTVEVDAVGEPEPDLTRLTLITNCLAAAAKVGALRDPENLPPFTRLDALRSLAARHGLRPTEVSFLYRLAGPPRRFRWTYRLVPEVTAREREAVARVVRARADAPFVRFEHYEAADED